MAADRPRLHHLHRLRLAVLPGRINGDGGDCRHHRRGVPRHVLRPPHYHLPAVGRGLRVHVEDPASFDRILDELLDGVLGDLLLRDQRRLPLHLRHGPAVLHPGGTGAQHHPAQHRDLVRRPHRHLHHRLRHDRHLRLHPAPRRRVVLPDAALGVLCSRPSAWSPPSSPWP